MLPSDRPYLIGETAFHHQGDATFLKTLVEQGVSCGIQAVKFHLLLDLNDYMVKNHPAKETLKAWCFDEETWTDIISYTVSKNIDVILLCNDVKSVQWATSLSFPVRAIELHSTGLNDLHLLEAASAFSKTIMLGYGGSTVDELQYAIQYLKTKGHQDIFLMHGFQSYPTNYKEINLAKMKKMQQLFDLPVGYADHTDPEDPYNEVISTSGIPQGFNVIEKHFTHAFDEKRIDSQAAVSLDQLKKIATLMQVLHKARGNGSLEMSSAELKYGETGPMKKAIVARHKIISGQEISMQDIAFKRTENKTAIRQNQLQQFIGAIASKTIEEDECINYSNVEVTVFSRNFDEFFVNK